MKIDSFHPRVPSGHRAGPDSRGHPKMPRGEHFLLTVLGTKLEGAVYRLGDSTQSAFLAPLGLLNLLPENRRPTRVLALCTKRAREISWPAMEGGLPDGCVAEAVDIPDGDRPEDVDIFLETVAKAVPDNTELTVDVTHGFRHFSFLTYVGVLYLAAMRDVKIRGAYYGLLRRGQECPFLDLGPLLELPRWIHALKVLSETGSALPMAEAIRARRDSGQPEVARDLHRALSAFSTAYLSGLPLELGAQQLILDQYLTPLRKRLTSVHRLPLATELVADLRKTMDRFGFPDRPTSLKDGWKRGIALSECELKRQARVVDALLRHRNRPVALGLMSEWTISWVAWMQRRTEDWLDWHGGRREASNALSALAAAADNAELRADLLDEQRRLGVFWKSLRDLRNGYAHHGIRRDDLISPNQHEARFRNVREYWRKLRECPTVRVAAGNGSETRLLVSPVGLRPGVLFSALHACRTQQGFAAEPTHCMAICSAESKGSIVEAVQAAGYHGGVTQLTLSEPHGGTAEIRRLVKAARRRVFAAGELLVNVTGGTTLMGIAAGAVANEGRRFARPVRRFGLIDRRPGREQDANPYQIGEAYWLDEEQER